MDDFLLKLDRFVRSNGSLDLVLNFIPGYRESVAPFRAAKSQGDLDVMLRTHRELIEYGVYLEELKDNEENPEVLLNKCMEVLQDREVEMMFDKYSSYMDKYLLHAEKIGIIFIDTEKHIKDDMVLSLAKAARRSRIMDAAAKINDGYNAKHWASQAFRSITRRCPKKDKEELRFTIDVMPYFKESMLKIGSTTQVDTYANLLNDMNTEDALRFLRHSGTWRSFPKDQNFRHWIHKFDNRLMPAIDYS